MREKNESFSGLTVLGAEVSSRNGRVVLEIVAVDDALLQGIKSKVTLAVRINALPGALGYEQKVDAEVSRLVGAWWNGAKGAAMGLQVDFDCPESKLVGYTRWVSGLRKELKLAQLSITTLPSWLRQEAFGELVKATDGYVLQVHSLARPGDLETAYSLCDPAEARRAVAVASKISVPFSIALPTYGYLLAFSTEGRFIGLSGEGPRQQWPVGSKLKTVRAETEAIVGLVRDWTISHPAHCNGIIWYRLPVDGDLLNWTWPTLKAVMDGRVPKAALGVELRHSEARLVEVDLCNKGEDYGNFPRELAFFAKGASMVAGDGLQGYEAVERREGEWILRRKTDDRLRPGERRMVGWVRLSKDVEVQVEISKN